MSVDVCFNIVFNNTGVDWAKLQYKIKEYIEKQTLHCISSKYYEGLKAPVQCIVDDTKIKMYFKVNTKDLVIDVIAVKAEDKLDIEEYSDDKSE